MAVFQADCPHCGTRNVAFTMMTQLHASKLAGNLWDTLCVCGNCSRSILATVRTPGANGPVNHLASGQIEQLRWEGIVPTPPETGAPVHTPPNVARFYEQGMDNLLGNWDAAGTMFRKALDVGLKIKFPGISGKLKARIDKAANQHGLTADLAEWAHQIRLDGNEAAHEEESFSREDAERLQTFTELVFRYLFTLPGMLEQARRAPEDNAPARAACSDRADPA